MTAPVTETSPIISLLYNHHHTQMGSPDLTVENQADVLKGYVIAHCLFLLFEQEDKLSEVLDNSNQLTSYALERFNDAVADYEGFKAYFKYCGGKMYVPTNETEKPYFAMSSERKAS